MAAYQYRFGWVLLLTAVENFCYASDDDGWSDVVTTSDTVVLLLCTMQRLFDFETERFSRLVLHEPDPFPVIPRTGECVTARQSCHMVNVESGDFRGVSFSGAGGEEKLEDPPPRRQVSEVPLGLLRRSKMSHMITGDLPSAGFRTRTLCVLMDHIRSTLGSLNLVNVASACRGCGWTGLGGGHCVMHFQASGGPKFIS